jgi:hypothetical protein
MEDEVARRYDGSLYTKFPIRVLKTEIQKSSMPDWLKTKFYRMAKYIKIKNVYSPVRPEFIYVGDIIVENYQNPMEFRDKDNKFFDGLSLKSTQALEEYLEQRGMFLQWVQYKKAGYMEARYFHLDTMSDKIKKSIWSFKEWRDEQESNFPYRFTYTEADFKEGWFKRLELWNYTALPDL